jgi:hypothetical protein
MVSENRKFSEVKSKFQNPPKMGDNSGEDRLMRNCTFTPKVFIYIYICILIYMYLYMYMYIHIHVHTRIHKHRHKYIYIYIYIHVWRG